MNSVTTRIDRAPFGTMPDGTAVERVVLRGADGFEAGIITFGAALQSLQARDRDGRSEDVVLGGTLIQLEANNGANTLHGGHHGFDRHLWRIDQLAEEPEPTLVLSYAS